MPIAIKPDGIFIKTWAIIRIATAFLLCLLIPVRFANYMFITSFRINIRLV